MEWRIGHLRESEVLSEDRFGSQPRDLALAACVSASASSLLCIMSANSLPTSRVPDVRTFIDPIDGGRVTGRLRAVGEFSSPPLGFLRRKAMAAFRWLAALPALLFLAPQISPQEPLWANDLVPKQPPARNAVPAKDDPALPTDNGSDSALQEELRTLARISDDQTYQDTGDPVVPTIGMVSHRATDLFIEGRGLDFSFDRRYSSHDSAEDGPLGFGWDHCYNLRLLVQLHPAKNTGIRS
jgi:hypothetical protein